MGNEGNCNIYPRHIFLYMTVQGWQTFYVLTLRETQWAHTLHRPQMASLWISNRELSLSTQIQQFITALWCILFFFNVYRLFQLGLLSDHVSYT